VLERQDIDALLVGALYGELTPADEARLSSHLESHPGDRSALDGLKLARQAIRDSRFFELQLDPPQQVSALLLQEAARRAPKVIIAKDGESWFARFVRSFVAHPAMAAAATLVLVVGVAGTLYMTKGTDQFAEQTSDKRAASHANESKAVVADPTAAGPAAGSAAVAAPAPDNGVPVDLAEGEDRGGKDQLDGKKVAVPAPKTTPTPSAHALRERQEPAKPVAPQKYVEVRPRTPEPTPKDLDNARSAKGDLADGNDAVKTGIGHAGGGASAANTPGTAAGLVPPPAPPPPAMATVDKPAQAKADTKTKEDPSASWARDQHDRMVKLVKAGNCADAAPIAVQIKNRAPDYYSAYVANDRALKQCMAYINEASERDAEKTQKSRPSKRSEAPAADAMH
jgi:hypothetical protein